MKNSFLFDSWTPETRRSHARKKTKEFFGKRTKSPSTKLPLSASFTTMPCSWPFWSSALFTSWKVFPLSLITLELCLWQLESLLYCPLVLNRTFLLKTHFLNYFWGMKFLWRNYPLLLIVFPRKKIHLIRNKIMYFFCTERINELEPRQYAIQRIFLVLNPKAYSFRFSCLSQSQFLAFLDLRRYQMHN